MSKEKLEITRVIFKEGGIQVLKNGVKNSLDAAKDKCTFKIEQGLVEIEGATFKTKVPFAHIRQIDFEKE